MLRTYLSMRAVAANSDPSGCLLGPSLEWTIVSGNAGRISAYVDYTRLLNNLSLNICTPNIFIQLGLIMPIIFYFKIQDYLGTVY